MDDVFHLGGLADMRAPTVADRVYEALYERVVTLALPPGTRLSEADVAKAAGVSRQPVRDAFWRLSQLGFLTIRPQRATEVSAISVAAVREARFVRTALEVETVQVATRAFGAAEYAVLEGDIAAQDEAVATGNREAFHALDDAFHQHICALTGHAYAWTLIREKKAHMDRVRFLSLTFGAPRAVEEHRDILAAMRSGDPAAAGAAMRAHLGRIEDILARIRVTHGEHFGGEG